MQAETSTGGSRPYFSTYALVVMAVLGAVSGVLAGAVLAPIGTAATAAFGPYGNGAVSGLFYFLPVVALMLIPKLGVGFIVIVLASIIQVVAGNPLGVQTAAGGFLIGALFEVGAWPFRWKPTLPAAVASGALATFGGTLYYGGYIFGLPLDALLPGLVIGLVSGAILSGLVGYGVAQALIRAGVGSGMRT